MSDVMCSLSLGPDGTLLVGGEFIATPSPTMGRWDGTGWSKLTYAGDSFIGGPGWQGTHVGFCKWCDSRLDPNRKTPNCPQCGGPNRW
jgi:hypothetical protein